MRGILIFAPPVGGRVEMDADDGSFRLLDPVFRD